MRAITTLITLLLSFGSLAADPAQKPATVSGKFEREGKTYTLTSGAAWQSARPDTLVLVLADTDIPPMAVRHATELQALAEGNKIHGLRFEFDPAHLDLNWISGRYMTATWNTYRGMPGRWKKLEIVNGRIAGALDANGVSMEFDIPLAGALAPKVLTGAEAQSSPQVATLLGYEAGMRKGNWKEAVKFLTPMSAEALKRDVSTAQGLGNFQTAGKYLKDFIPAGDERRKQVQQVLISGEDAAVVGEGFAADFVLVNGRWLKI